MQQFYQDTSSHMIPRTQASPMFVKGQSNLKKEAARKKQRGQLVLEYLLLMVFAVAVASLIKTQFIGGDPDDPENAGVMTKLIYNIALPIASDTPSE